MKWYEALIDPSPVINKLYEESVLQLRKGDVKRVKRVREQALKIAYKGVDKKGIIHFTCTSGTVKGKFYNISIQLKDLEEAKKLIIDNKPLSNRDIVKLAISGDIAIHCSCPDFKYRFTYMAWSKGYGLLRETRYPKITNRYLKGTVCKHSIAVLNAFPMYFMSIQSDLTKRGFLHKPLAKKQKRKSK